MIKMVCTGDLRRNRQTTTTRLFLGPFWEGEGENKRRGKIHKKKKNQALGIPTAPTPSLLRSSPSPTHGVLSETVPDNPNAMGTQLL